MLHGEQDGVTPEDIGHLSVGSGREVCVAWRITWDGIGAHVTRDREHKRGRAKLCCAR
jgi:hypothetical protein